MYWRAGQACVNVVDICQAAMQGIFDRYAQMGTVDVGGSQIFNHPRRGSHRKALNKLPICVALPDGLPMGQYAR